MKKYKQSMIAFLCTLEYMFQQFDDLIFEDRHRAKKTEAVKSFEEIMAQITENTNEPEAES